MAATRPARKQPDAPSITGQLRMVPEDFDAVWRALPPVRFMRAVLLLQVVASAVVTLSVMPAVFERSLAVADWLLLTPLVWAAVMVLLWLWVPKVWARAILRDSYFEGDVCFEVQRHLLCLRGGPLNARVAFDDVTRVIELPRHFLIFPKPLSAFVLPKRAFRDQDLAALRDRLQAYLPSVPASRIPLGRIIKLALLAVALLSVWHFFSLEPAPPR